MVRLHSSSIHTPWGEKEIAVYYGDVCLFDQDIDILTTSAFIGAYAPTPRTVFHALKTHSISVSELAKKPAIDLRDACQVWLSEEIIGASCPIRRIGCIELISGKYRSSYDMTKIEQSMINSIRAYFSMLDIGAIYGIKMDTVALPLLGSGNQNISAELMIVPLLNECINFLKRNSEVKRIYFIEKNAEKAIMISQYLQTSYNILNQGAVNQSTDKIEKKIAFISYATPDKNIADNLCSKLEQKGVAVWYAPRDVRGPYADSITQAIDKCAYFIVILSQNSMRSQHVLNEIDLAFQHLPNEIKFKPLRIDDSIFTASFKYYLSRQHWMDAIDPPLEARLSEFVEKLLLDQ